MLMKRNLIVGAAMAATLGLTLVGCGGAPATNGSQQGSGSAATQKDANDFVEQYRGQWRGSVEITGQTVYGTAGGTEQMLDVYLEKDGTARVKPLDSHADLLTAEGTWDAVEGKITLHLPKGDIEIKVTDKDKAEAKAADFGIADFETLNFDFYG